MQNQTNATSAEATAMLRSYIIATVEPSALSNVVEQVKKEQGIRLVTPTTGRYNLLVQLNAAETDNIYSHINKLRSIPGVRRTRALVPFEGRPAEKKPQNTETLAFSLLRVKDQPSKVFERVKQAPIHSAYVVPGEFDILATVSGRDHNEVLERVTRVAETPGVAECETMFAHGPTWGP
jgi:DNA-binding Lrp family transcriptional regulator